MRIFLLCLTLLSILTNSGKSQPDQPSLAAEKAALAIPDSLTMNPELIAGWFRSNLEGQEQMVGAIYTWTAMNISYDVKNMFSIRPPENTGLLIKKTLEGRMAVCQGYAELFRELCLLCGIRCRVVQGYTRQNGEIMNLSHAWVVAVIDSAWYLFDPTWGSGYVSEGRFNRRFNYEHYLVPPRKFILTHMPFDPMWQCLEHPWTSDDFYRGKQVGVPVGEPFRYADSIAAWESAPEKRQMEDALRRIEANGIVNNNLADYARNLQQNISILAMNDENARRNEMVNRYNDAVKYYNNASRLFSEYVTFWNRQFKPAIPDGELMHMIDTCQVSLDLSRSILGGIVPAEENMVKNKEMLLESIGQMQVQADRQREFVRKYITTPKAGRPALFRNPPK